MSYDLDVYARVSLTSRDLAKIPSTPGVRTQRDRGWGAKGVSALDEHDRHAFTIEGPSRVEREDVPKDIVAAGGAAVVYSIQVPYAVSDSGSAFRAVPDARHLAAARTYASNLARRVEGVVVDPQMDDAPNQRSSAERGPSASTLYLHLEWFRRMEDSPESKALAENYLRSARASFPPAVPTRFGSREPLKGRLPRDGDDAFGDLYRAECRLNAMIMTDKGLSGSISPWSSITSTGYQSASAVLELARIEKTGAVDKVHSFIAEMARLSGSFFAFAEVNSSQYATARPRGFDGAWGGLPTDPQWVTWYDAEYAPLVRRYLTQGQIEEFSDGVLHRWSEAPTGAEEIRRSLGRNDWVPAELRGVLDHTPNGIRGRVPAKVLPASLRAPQ
ncbi:MAG: hypothetical protein ACRDT7_10820 [Microbacterium sp.]